MKMFNKLLLQNGFKTISAGIGLGCDQELIIKAGQSGSGINDKIWIGKAVVDACHLGNKANRNGISPIAMSPIFYENIKAIIEEENSNYKNWISAYRVSYNYSPEFYHCNIVEIDFDKWIDTGV